MPKSYKNKKNKKGGFWEKLNLFAKKTTPSPYVPPVEPAVTPPAPAAESAVTPPAPAAESAVTPPAPAAESAVAAGRPGGRRRKSRRRRSRKHKKQRGGVHPNETSSRLALNAMPFSGKTAEPQVWLGGKTRKRRKNKRRSKSHKKRKH
jgi:hypothetical protein